MSVFTEPLIEDLDISRTQLSGAYLIATLTGAAFLPLVGRALDRYGVRVLVTGAAVLFGAVLAGSALVGSIWGLTAGLAGLRLSGQGALSLLATTTVALWFTRNRGTSLGLVTSVGAAGISVTPVLTERLIAATDWRTAWLIQGLVIWTVLIPVGVYGLRGRPPAAVRDTSRPGPAGGWTVGRSMRTAAFWTIIAAVCCQGMLTTAVAFHQVSLLGEHGLSPTEAAANFLPQTMAGLAAAFLVGALADRFPPRLVLAASLAVLAAGLLWTPLLAPGLSGITFGLLLGAAGNGVRTLEASIVPAYFGTAHIGALRGIVHAATVASTAFGPVLLSLGHDLVGSYTPALMLSAAVPALIAVIVILVPPPNRPTADGHEGKSG
ncbi:MFS transporter [Actinomadura sp. 3N407]|uniref:MFS transporter n=1 Tax=Actinomadura sp. 3N407 TaxID=3457423 RepID=UPI003FCE6D02